METISVPPQYHGRTLGRFLLRHFKGLPPGAFYKALRKKDIRVNGVRVNRNIVVNSGDRIDVFIPDNILNGAAEAERQESKILLPSEDIIFEDDNLLLVDKKPGISVHGDGSSSGHALIDMVIGYLEKKGDYDPRKPGSFKPALCHRLDRNTGGIVIIAKTPQALRVMLDSIRKRDVRKFYQCIVMGCPAESLAELRHYLVKDSRSSRVYISDERKPGAAEIITRYRVLVPGRDMSRLEVEIITGKTHQIRAHLAFIGHPVVGDDKYGNKRFNRKVGAKYQALRAYKVVFDFKDGGVLDYLKGGVFETRDIDFPFEIRSQ